MSPIFRESKAMKVVVEKLGLNHFPASTVLNTVLTKFIDALT